MINTYSSTGYVVINDQDPQVIIELYEKGFLATRIQKGHFIKTRSVRVNLTKFTLSSENKRILKKFDLNIKFKELPTTFDKEMFFMAKNFYDRKFGKDTMSAYKIKEIITSQTNFNLVLTFCSKNDNQNLGFCFCKEVKYNNTSILHYAYPFYSITHNNLGIYMMTSTIKLLKEMNYLYIYLGSCTNPKCRYKLQFKGLEWFDTESNTWNEDIKKLKKIILENQDDTSHLSNTLK